MSDGTYHLSARQTVVVRRSGADTDGEVLEVEATWTGGGDLPPTHLHPSQDEHFEVTEGELRVLLDGTERRVAAGEVLDIPRGTAHAMTATDKGARAVWQTRPALRTEQFFAAMDEAHQRGGSIADLVPVARAHRAEVRFTSPPPWLQVPLFATLAVLGKLRRRRRV
ncbi:MAG TPA: cupin domain-containing protein [Actinophytocola sp.]|jgi:quercetin dioxygenase-like cupin family protein|uniref:cupin domain-containing protein n=1 Tax=Actinophytocola sp. TaxID=1872138 RepID=UPI002F93BEBD